MCGALTVNLKEFLSENYALLSILIGSALFAFTLGPFSNFDTNVEFEAASSVVKVGMPYMSTGFLINQPPLGFYINSLFFKIFGLSFNVGVNVVTFFSLGCIVLIYLIGKAWYGKTAGLFASALFALTPWQVIFSRSFLIDMQYLFFGLLSLLIAIHAVRKDSLKLFMLSGVFFGLAFLTKFFAVFMLIPLALFYFSNRQRLLSRWYVPLMFFIPVMIFFFIWYWVVLGVSLVTALSHDDFNHFNLAGLEPSYLFVGKFLLNALGLLSLSATAFSLLFTFIQKKLFKKVLTFDLICLATILAIAGVDTFMAVGLNFRAPYSGAIKYTFQVLPFVCLIAASLLGKFQITFYEKIKPNHSMLVLVVALAGSVLLVATIFLNMYYAASILKQDTIVFQVEGDTAYSFVNSAATQAAGLVYVQYLGLALVVSGLIWAVKGKAMAFLKYAKNAKTANAF